MSRARDAHRGRWRGLNRRWRGADVSWSGLIVDPCSLARVRSKQALVHRVCVRTDGPTLYSVAAERGPSSLRGSERKLSRTPAGLAALPAPELSPELERSARVILEAIAAAVEGCEAGVELTESEMVSSVCPGPRRHGRARLGTLEVRLGPSTDRPAWARTLLWPAPCARPPRTRLDALVRLCRIHAATITCVREEDAPPPDFPGVPVAMTSDAVADLLRQAVRSWSGARAGTRVGPGTLDLTALGADALAAVDLPPRGGVPLVRAGRLTRRAVTPPELADGSWRDPPRRGWPLVFAGSSARIEPMQPRVCLLAGVIPIGGIPWGRGAWLDTGNVRSTWGPAPIPPVSWWVRQMEAGWGDPVADGTGVPVACPGFVAPAAVGDR